MSVINQTKSILLIDDEPSIRELVRVCLQDLAGWRVITAPNAQVGLQCLEEECPDVILLDVLMPGMDAVTFINKLREKTLTQSVPVILLTVRARWFTSAKLEQLGVSDAIAKPFNPLTLATQIAQTLGWSL
ncbi:MAG: response regulator [Scytolyngbya sp. HA4215-MV1]|nr:response regulator [Scytolyngbya sp. HA4215-MV1]